jgi:predicted transcriptional regulator
MVAGGHDELAVEDTKELLTRADRLGFRRKEIAEILGVSVQRVSDYYKVVKSGTGDAIPSNSRKVLRRALEQREAEKPSSKLAYPSERGAYTHDLLEKLGAETNFSGARWNLVVRLIEEALRQPKEEGNNNGPGNAHD